MNKSEIVFGNCNEKASEDCESRRTFMKKACAATITIAGSDFTVPGDPESECLQSKNAVLPWYRRITRWGQTNITETDPATYDIKWWRSYWKRTHIRRNNCQCRWYRSILSQQNTSSPSGRVTGGT